MLTLETRIFPVTDLQRDGETLEMAAELLRNGKLVVFPTETVYGLGANALDSQAVSKIFEAKGRPQDNPLIVHVAQLEEILPLVKEFPPAAQQLADRFWPGPLTLVLPKSHRVPDAVSAGLDTVAVRMPSHPVARALLQEAKVPVAAPSANRSGRPSPTTAQHCLQDLEGRVELILDGGPCDVGLESTVLSLCGPKPRLLRPGGVTPEQLEEVLGEVEMDHAVIHQIDADQPVNSPGMKYRHYAPKARVVLVHGGRDAFFSHFQREYQDGDYALVFDGDETDLPHLCYGREDYPEEQAERLFAALRELDEQGASRVLVRVTGRKGIGLAVYNRLLRAAAFREVFLESGI